MPLYGHHITVTLFLSLFLYPLSDLSAQQISGGEELQAIEHIARSGDAGIIKCGWPLLMQYQTNRNLLSPEVAEAIESMSGSTVQAEFTYLSPGGRFEIHYDRNGTHAVPEGDSDPANGIPDFVDQVAAAADSSWRHQVVNLGFADPVTGAANPYPIFIENLNVEPYNNPYGITFPGSFRDPNLDTYIVVNSNLDDPGFLKNDDSNPLYGAIKVTVAHELKHAIQYANSEWYEPGDLQSPHSLAWSEADATLMEEVVYDNVNDYYTYIFDESDSIFLSSNHHVPGSYYGVSWPIYFHERYGDTFWPGVWNRIKERYNEQESNSVPDFLTMMEAISMTLEDDFNDLPGIAFAESHLWHYASGSDNSRAGYGFDEKLNYPGPELNLTLTARDSTGSYQSLIPLSSDYIEVYRGTGLDGYVQVLVEYLAPSTDIGLIAFFTDGSVDQLIRPGNSSGTLNLTTTWEWTSIQKIGIVVGNSSETTSTDYALTVTSNLPEEIRLVQNYPNPFNPGTTIEFAITQESKVELGVYDVTGRLVSTLVNEEMTAGFYEVEFNAANLASGVYIYRLVTDGEVIVKKMTLIK